MIQTFPDNLLEISFRNSVGLTRIGPLPVVVRNLKIAEPQYQTMLDAVVAKVASLIFGFGQPTGQNVQRGQPGKDVAYLEMCFLRMALLREKPDIDAIAGVQGAFILYPGLETAMFAPLDQTFPGVGALALRPDQDAVPFPEQGVSVGRILDMFLDLGKNDG